MSSRYERFYLRVRDRAPAIFVVARLASWCARKVRAYPVLTFGYLALIAGLAVGGLALQPELPGVALLTAAAVSTVAGVLMIAIGFNRFLLKEAQNGIEIKHLNLRRRVERTEAALREEPATRAEMVLLRSSQDQLQRRIDSDLARLRSGQDALRAESRDDRALVLSTLLGKIAGLIEEQTSMRDWVAAEIAAVKNEQRSMAAHEAKIEQLGAAQAASHASLTAALAATQPDLKPELERLRSAQQAAHQALAADFEALKARHDAMSELAGEVERLKAGQVGVLRLADELERIRANQASIHERLETEISSRRSKRNVGQALESAIAELVSAQEATHAALESEIRFRERTGNGSSDGFEAQVTSNNSPAGESSRTGP